MAESIDPGAHRGRGRTRARLSDASRRCGGTSARERRSLGAAADCRNAAGARHPGGEGAPAQQCGRHRARRDGPAIRLGRHRKRERWLRLLRPDPVRVRSLQYFRFRERQPVRPPPASRFVATSKRYCRGTSSCLPNTATSPRTWDSMSVRAASFTARRRGVRLSRLSEDDVEGRGWLRRWIGVRRIVE